MQSDPGTRLFLGVPSNLRCRHFPRVGKVHGSGRQATCQARSNIDPWREETLDSSPEFASVSALASDRCCSCYSSTRYSASCCGMKALVVCGRGEPGAPVQRHVGAALSGGQGSGGTLAGSDDETARVWDAKTGAQLLTLSRHLVNVRAVAVSPDGTRIVTGSADTSAPVWDSATDTELVVLRGHTSHVWGVSFTPNGGAGVRLPSAGKTSELVRGTSEMAVHSGRKHQVGDVDWRTKRSSALQSRRVSCHKVSM
jgi:WD40 repeat protein